jgi:hypothetical protein
MSSSLLSTKGIGTSTLPTLTGIFSTTFALALDCDLVDLVDFVFVDCAGLVDLLDLVAGGEEGGGARGRSSSESSSEEEEEEEDIMTLCFPFPLDWVALVSRVEAFDGGSLKVTERDLVLLPVAVAAE